MINKLQPNLKALVSDKTTYIYNFFLDSLFIPKFVLNFSLHLVLLNVPYLQTFNHDGGDYVNNYELYARAQSTSLGSGTSFVTCSRLYTRASTGYIELRTRVGVMWAVPVKGTGLFTSTSMSQSAGQVARMVMCLVSMSMRTSTSSIRWCTAEPGSGGGLYWVCCVGMKLVLTVYGEPLQEVVVCFMGLGRVASLRALYWEIFVQASQVMVQSVILYP